MTDRTEVIPSSTSAGLTDHSPDPIPTAEVPARVNALEQLLIEQGLVTASAIDKIAATFERDISPRLGAKVVARAWVDERFRAELLEDATSACRSMGIGGAQGEYMVAVANTSTVHNVVVCTLCSCYPWPVLGLPPNWYKYPQYRASIVNEPRRVLRDDFGLTLEPDVEIRIWDSSSEIRYFVLPERPADTAGLAEHELAELVTRDAMIGVAR